MKPWGGRFTKDTDPLMEQFSSSIGFDRVLYDVDIEGSKAHAEMLERIGILSLSERDEIIAALDEIKAEIGNGEFAFSNRLEDIHMHIEARLIEKTGDPGKKLHTGRSRNDQISLDMRMYLKDKTKRIDSLLVKLLESIVRKAQEEKETIMPGYTHMRMAQVTTFAHYLMAYFYMLKRDRERLSEARKRIDVLPLGSGAIAGSTIPLDREFVGEKLNFSKITENSMDAVSDRDFVTETIFCCAMVMTHLSRLAEDLIVFSTEEFAFVSLPDELCTGSSLMPHKKNPDSLELIRGKTSRVIGDLMSLLTLMKGLPLTYNRDLQEDKEPLFHAVDTTGDSLMVMELCVKGIMLDRGKMKDAVYGSYMPAVEIAEYLVLKGVPFREAHAIVGTMVKDCIEDKKGFGKLTLEELRSYSGLFDGDIFGYIDPVAVLKNRKTTGAASFETVEKEIATALDYINVS